MPEELAWQGALTSVQPRIRLTRSFDQRSHSYLGYALRAEGAVGDRDRVCLVGVGNGAHAKHRFRVVDRVSGLCLPVAGPDLDPEGARPQGHGLGGGRLGGRGRNVAPPPR